MPDRFIGYPDGVDEIDRAFLDSIKAIDDGAFVQGYMVIVSFVQPDGRNCWRLVHNLEIPATQAMGLCQLASMELAILSKAVTDVRDLDEE